MPLEPGQDRTQIVLRGDVALDTRRRV